MSRGPLVTLVVVLGAALALLVVNLSSAGPSTPGNAGSAAPATTATAAPPPAAAAAVFPAKAKYVGQATTDAGPVPIAVTVDGDRAKAYLCDNKKIESWFQGSADGGKVDAGGKAPAKLSARLDGDKLTGTVVVSGYPEWTFDASPTTNPRAGVYRASNDKRTAGWIVQGSGDQVGLGRTPDGAVIPAVPLPADGPLPAGVAPVDGGTDVLTGP